MQPRIALGHDGPGLPKGGLGGSRKPPLRNPIAMFFEEGKNVVGRHRTASVSKTMALLGLGAVRWIDFHLIGFSSILHGG
jgi:hypothetical protein